MKLSPLVLTNSDLLQWCTTRLVSSRAQFEAAAAADGNQLIVLRFELQPDDMSKPQGSSSYTIVFSSPNMLRNVLLAIEGKPDGVNLSTDGTYKIALCGWVLVDMGTTSLYFDRKGDAWRHKFFPFLYIFCRTERADRVAVGFEVLRDCTANFFERPAFVPRILQIDHTEAFVNGARTVWGDAVDVATCWPHMARKALGDNKGLFQNQAFFQTAEKHMHKLHLARTLPQFLNIWGAVKREWEAAGELALVAWFQQYYITQPWAAWFVTASGVPGIPSNNQPIESEHKLIKVKKITELRAVMGRVLHKQFPHLLKSAADPQSAQVGVPIAGTYAIACGTKPVPIPREVLFQAKEFLEPGPGGRLNYKLFDIRVPGQAGAEATVVKALAVNSSHHTVKLVAGGRANVSEQRIRNYRRCMQEAVEFDSVDAAEYAALSMYIVERRARPRRHGHPAAAPGNAPEEPPVDVDSDTEVFYFCRCKGSFQTGGLCSHILLMRHLDGDFDIPTAVGEISSVRRPGRPRKATAALQPQPAEDPRSPPASFYVGAKFAKFFPALSPVAFHGKVVDTRRVLGQNIAANILYKIQYRIYINYCPVLNI